MAFPPDIDPKNGKIDEPIALRGEAEFLAADTAGKVYIFDPGVRRRRRRLESGHLNAVASWKACSGKSWRGPLAGTSAFKLTFARL